MQFEPLEERTVPAFLTPVDYNIASYPQAPLTADFNGDGQPDLAVANYYGSSISVLLGNADGTFQAAQDSTTGNYPSSLAAGDLNGDSRLDLVSVSSSGVTVLLGSGDGTFQPGSSVNGSAFPVSVAVGDLNDDNKMDLVVPGNISVLDGYYYGYYGGRYPHYHNEGVAQVFLGNGDGSFGSAQTTELGFIAIRDAAVADFNGDGKDDFATVNNSNSSVAVLLASSDGSLLTPGNIATGSYPRSVSVGDFNGDGVNDLATMNSSSVGILLGNGVAGVGDGTFRPAQITELNSYPTSVAVGDFNADGKLDLGATWNRFVVDYYGYYGSYGHNEGYVSVLLGQGNSFFAAAESTWLGETTLTGMASGDFNGDDHFDLALFNEGTYFQSPNRVSVLLNDQLWSPLPPPSVSINNVSVAEGNIGTTSVTFAVSLQFAHDEAITVDYTTIELNATDGTDYIGVSGQVTFAPGQTSKPITVEVLGDRLAESTESFAVYLTASNAPFVDAWGFCTILDDEPIASLSGPAPVTEGNTGTTDAIFTITLSAAYDAPFEVEYSSTDLTGDWQYYFGPSATAGLDYSAANGTVVFAPGETSKTFTVPILGDRIGESDEYFMVYLGEPNDPNLGSSPVLVQIVDDEPRVYVEGGSVVEGNTDTKPLTFTITLSNSTDVPVTVSYATVNGSAAGNDYVAASGTVTFAPGQTSKTIAVQVKGDRLGEDDEQFYLNLTGATGALLGYDWGYATIFDNEPRISIDSKCIQEGNSGSRLMTFTVTLSEAYDQSVTVRYATSNYTARSGKDYVSTSGTLTFSPGQTSRTFTVSIKGDRLREYDEEFYVLLSRPSSNASIWEAYGWGTILDDDWPNG